MKYCTNCGGKLTTEKKFCKGCGNKIPEHKHVAKQESSPHEKKKTQHSTHKNLSPWLMPWVVFCVVLVVAGGLLLPTKIVYENIEVEYIDTEQYTVEVPYEDLEPYVLSVPYKTSEQYVVSIPVTEQEENVQNVCNNVKLKYTVEWNGCSSSNLLGNGKSSIRVTNTDTETGYFSFNVGYVSDSGEFISGVITKSISSGSSKTLTYSPMPTSFDKCRYTEEAITTKEVCSLDVGYKTVTNYKDQIKVRDKTEYRDETKYRTVTKTRTETREREKRKTRVEEKAVEVNRFFGFDALIKFQT
jgi:hypothetical protein